MVKKSEVVEQVGFTLPNKKIQVRPVKRKGQWLPSDHSGSFLYDNAHITMEVPIDSRTGRRANILTKEEREFFENPSVSGLDFKPGELGENRRENNFWDTFTITLRKITEEIDLSDPMEYLRYAVLRSNTGSHGLIAPSWDKRFDYPTYKYALVEADYDVEQGAKKAENALNAYAFFNQISDSYEKLYDFLMVYWLEKKGAMRPSPNSKKDMLKSAVQQIIESDMTGFLSIVNNPMSYDKKLFLHKAIENGHIDYNGKDTYRLMPEDIIIGATTSEAIDYLYSTKNQETLLRIRALMEQKESN